MSRTSPWGDCVLEKACGWGGLAQAPGAKLEGDLSLRDKEVATGEGIGYTLQYSCTSLVAQMVKNLPAMQETLVQS